MMNTVRKTMTALEIFNAIENLRRRLKISKTI